MLREHYLPRLAFIRHLYETGVEQFQQPYPLSAKSLLTFHDAIEMFLVLGMIHLNSGGDPKINFDKYIVEINKSLALKATALSGQVRINGLNNARVNFKHHVNYPASIDLATFRNTANDFFIDNTPIIFDGLDFNDISMSDLVTLVVARQLLHEAEQLIQTNDFSKAIEKIALSFHEIMDFVALYTYGEQYSDLPLFSVSETSQFNFSPPRTGDREVDKFLKNTSSSMKKVQSALKIMILGLDLQKYRRFLSITPQIIRFMDGRIETNIRPGMFITKETCNEAMGFVLSSSLHLQEFIDFSAAIPTPDEENESS